MIMWFENSIIAQQWYNDDWQYRQEVSINNTEGTELIDYQVLITPDSSFDFLKANYDGSDIRITDSDGISLLPFWIDEWDAGTSQASMWVKVPIIPVLGTALYFYYGNALAISESNGDNTFDFFDDFESPTTIQYGYFNFSQTPTTILNDHQPWESTAPHTLDVVELNQDGYKYWGYYSLQEYPEGGPIGLARSNDLENWTKYEFNPILTGQKRWVSVIQMGDSLYMGYTEYTGVSSIVLSVSLPGPDFGINFSEIKTLVPEEPGFYNGSPNFFLNPNDGLYYMYYVRINTSTNYRDIMVKFAANIEDLDIAPAQIVASSATTFSAPNMMYYDGTYFLGVETSPSGVWNTEIWASDSPVTGFSRLPGNPILSTGEACLYQHIFNDSLYMYYAKKTGSTWTMEYRAADLADGRIEYQAQGPLDPLKWTPSSGDWFATEAIEQNGLAGVVAQGNTTGIQILQSNGFTGTDYIVEVFGRQLSGPEWGLCSRVTATDNFYVCNLYDNHDYTDNLYNYNWMPASHPVIGKTALGPIITNTWYEMSVKVFDDTLSTSINGTEWLKVQNTQHTSGGIALFGENGTNAQFNDLRVRKYASIEPDISFGEEQFLSFGIDIGLELISCGKFEVKLRPDINISNNHLTNIQFTLKWPTNTVSLVNFNSNFGVTQQGPVIIENDTNYAIFVSASSIPISWTADTEYTIMSFAHDQLGSGNTTFALDTSGWADLNNGVFYIEILGANNTGLVYQNADNVLLETCGQLNLKAFLQGSYQISSGLMNSKLNDAENLPLDQPYNNEPWLYDGTENVITMPSNVVDWVLVELRDAPDALSATVSTRINRQAALLLNNGTIIGTNGLTLRLNTATLQQLFVVLWHRNHLGIISSNELPPITDDYYIYDFSTAASQAFGDGLYHFGNGVYGMIGGDAQPDGIIDFSDIIQIWSIEAGSTGYLNGDMNMDGETNNLDKNDIWYENLYEDSQVQD